MWQFEAPVVKLKDTCSKLSFFLRVLPPPALRNSGADPNGSTSSAALASFRFRNWLSGFGFVFFFSLLGERKACIKITFSSLLCSVENLPWLCPGIDPFLYFSQHSLVKGLLSLDPRRKGLSLFPRYPALLHWYPGPQGLQARPLVLKTLGLPQAVFFCLAFFPPNYLVLRSYLNPFAHKSHPSHEAVCFFLKAARIWPPFLSHGLCFSLTQWVHFEKAPNS